MTVDVSALQGAQQALGSWLAEPLRTETGWIQTGLWAFLLLAVLWTMLEPLQRRWGRLGRGASLVTLPGGLLPAGSRYQVNGRPVVIGRGEDADLRIPSGRVAVAHASISEAESGYQVSDLGSREGVSLNGRRVDHRAPLRNGDLLDIGGTPFRFEWTRTGWEQFEARNWLFLVGASLLFWLIQRTAWQVAGAGRPAEPLFLRWTAGLLAGAWAVEILVRRVRKRTDSLMMPAVLVLLGLGLAVLLRARPELYGRQASAGAAGLALMALVALAPLRGLAGYRFLSFVGAMVLLGATVVMGHRVGDQRLAISLFGLQFQPAEPAKVLLAVFLAGLLSERQELVARAGRSWRLTRSDIRYLGPVALAWALALGLLIVQRDLGTALLFFGLFVAFVGMASGRIIFLFLSLSAFAFGAVFSASAFDRVRERMDLWLNPWQDPQGLGYQLCQGLFALGAGGVQGLGLGSGFPGLVPAAHTDLPLAVIGEELGLLGTLAMLGLYGLLAVRGYRAARRSEDDFLGLLAAGLTTALVLQTLVIVGGIVRALPLTGVTLPFISFGGSSLVVNLALAGALLGIAAAPAGGPGAAGLRASPYSWKRHLRWVRAFAFLGLVTLAGFLVYWQAIESRPLAIHPNNPRLLILEPRLNRGPIVASNSEVLARSALEGDRYERRYAYGSLVGGILGYSSLRHGKVGVEKQADLALLGVREGATISEALERARRGTPGSTARLTLSLPLQQAAANALGERRGSVVALDPRTGAIRAMVSWPRASFDRLDQRWEELVRDRTRPFLFRAAQGVYPPGSTFKTVTAATALEAGVVTPESRFYCPGSATIGRYSWHCFGGESHGHLLFADALRVSCNVTFGTVGYRLGRERLNAGAHRLGIGEPPPLEIPTAGGILDPNPRPWRSIPIQIGFGQGPLAVTPLQMALVASGIANGGVVMRPHLIQDYETPAKQVLWRAKPEPWKQAMSARTAHTVRDMMVRVVQAGTGRAADIPGIQVAGKTGTAENPHGQDHAWFICFAPAQQPKLAVAVLVEGGGQGGRVAAPVARQVLETYFGVKETKQVGLPRHRRRRH